MKTFETEIQIDAAPARVWHMLTDDMPRAPEAYGILRLDGTLAKGAKLKLWSEVSPKRAFALKVTGFDAPHSMVWTGGMPFGLFVGTRTFTITGAGSGSTFHMIEVFSGPMAGLITKSIPDLTPSFKKFAQTLKQRAEQND
ncbi:SRPBCC domain-containing protein [uncultured Tateyamaria sp.]|uniref:SRPBCC domain-containing protein n=1 Tax=uncultured Tateyamaria sp. TaxID=455651 RepID=UPI002612D945|nr:SRPBCC domain-containing protein [uncultured Tateyamaria sp.]